MYRLRDFSMRREQRLASDLLQQVPSKSSYLVDLPRFLAVCEANFLRLEKLTQAMQVEQLHFSLQRGTRSIAHQLVLTERAKFTTTWRFDFDCTSSQWLPSPRVLLRAYHDAALVEVLEWQGHKRLKPRYPQPNAQAYARDEKLQVNRFLGECFEDCLANGLSSAVTLPNFP